MGAINNVYEFFCICVQLTMYMNTSVAAIHLGLDCLLKQKQSSEKEIQDSLEIITCDPSIYTIDNPDITVSKH